MRWTITAATDPTLAWISPTSLRAHLPLGADDHSRYVRLHELGHVRWSPFSGPIDVEENAAEDARMLALQLEDATLEEDARELLVAGYSRFLPSTHVPSLLGAVSMLGHASCEADRRYVRRFPAVWDALVGLAPACWSPLTGWRITRPPFSATRQLAMALRTYRS